MGRLVSKSDNARPASRVGYLQGAAPGIRAMDGRVVGDPFQMDEVYRAYRISLLIPIVEIYRRCRTGAELGRYGAPHRNYAQDTCPPLTIFPRINLVIPVEVALF